MRQPILRALLTIMAIILMAPAPCFAETAALPDIRGHWSEPYVSALVDKGSIAGMPDGLFHPDDFMTFPQFVSIIITNGYGRQSPVNGHWASGYMQTALDNGVIESDDMEKLEEITRFDAARVALNALALVFGEEYEPDIMSESEFVDFSAYCMSCQTSLAYARECYVKGIIAGRPSPDGPVFNGEDYLTRAEGSVIIMKMLEPGLRTPPN